MKVYIGPYTSWIGPYQIADKIFFWIDKDNEELENRWDYRLHNRFGGWLAKDSNGKDSRLLKFCQWVETKRKRTVKVRIDPYDVWNAEHTLALIILPVLKELKKNKHGSPNVDYSDVPDELWPTELANGSNFYTDNTIHERWTWVLDEIIWAFEQIADTDDDEGQFYDHTNADDPNDDLMTQVGKIKVDREGLAAHQERKARGLYLFGKYYQGLWD